MAFREFTDPDLGTVRVATRANARGMKTRWNKGRVEFIISPDTTSEMFMRFFNEVKPRLIEMKRPLMFEIGRPLHTDDGPTFSFERSERSSGGVTIVLGKERCAVRIGRDVNLEDPRLNGVISKLLLRAAYSLSPGVLTPLVEAEANRLGLKPSGIEISRGHVVLGHCSQRGVIAISCACLFLPRDLRRYIVCHELAHLTEMNHSARFHSLCDRYLEGREAELIRALKGYRWPIER